MRQIVASIVAALGVACGAGAAVDGVDSDVPMERAEVEALPVFPGPLVLETKYLIHDERAGSPRDLAVGIVVRNEGPQELVGGRDLGRSWWFDAYDNPDRNGSPVWSGLAFTGRGALQQVRIPPGGSQHLGGGGLGLIGAVPPGTYYFSAALVLTDPGIRTPFLPAGQVEIPE